MSAELSPSVIAEAIITVMRGPAGNGPVDPVRAASLAQLIHEPLARTLGRTAPADLSGNLTFKRLLSEHLQPSAADQLEHYRQATLRAIETANVHGADYTGALSFAARLAGTGIDIHRLAHAIAAAEGRGGRGSLERTLGLTAGYYTANNLPLEIRDHIDGPRATASQVAAAANYVTSIGLDAGRFAGHFVGASATVKAALQQHIRTGAALTDSHITSANDARAIIAAVQAGRIKAEDAPPSVRQIMKDMKAKGIDPATASARDIGAYFQQNPQALAVAKAANNAAVSAEARLTPEQRAARAAEIENRALAAAPTSPMSTALSALALTSPVAQPSRPAVPSTPYRLATALTPPSMAQAPPGASPPGRSARLSLD